LLLKGAHREGEVNPHCLVDVELERRLEHLLESFQFRRHRVGARLEFGDDVVAAIVAD